MSGTFTLTVTVRERLWDTTHLAALKCQELIQKQADQIILLCTCRPKRLAKCFNMEKHELVQASSCFLPVYDLFLYKYDWKEV